MFSCVWLLMVVHCIADLFLLRALDYFEFLLSYRGHTDAVLCLQFDGHKLVSGSKDTTIKVHVCAL